METISNILFFISNGLLVPVVIALLVLFGVALYTAINFYGDYQQRKNLLKQTEFLNSNDREVIFLGLQELEEKDSLYLKDLKLLWENRENEAFCERLIANYEVESHKRLSRPRMLLKLGPMLGLMGTLIPMGPALVWLANGDISSMAYNMQVAFSTTVVGLIIAVVGIVTLQVKQRWFSLEMNNLDYVDKVLHHEER
jgi:biopolymer transport protein ExbB/TolQ